MEYLTLFIAVLFGTAGVLFGFLLVLQIVHSSKERKRIKTQRKYLKMDHGAYQESVDTENDDRKPEVQGLLKERLGKEKESWTQFNCECDQKDVRKQIESLQKKEDHAYRFIKQRQKNKKE